MPERVLQHILYVTVKASFCLIQTLFALFRHFLPYSDSFGLTQTLLPDLEAFCLIWRLLALFRRFWPYFDAFGLIQTHLALFRRILTAGQFKCRILRTERSFHFRIITVCTRHSLDSCHRLAACCDVAVSSTDLSLQYSCESPTSYHQTSSRFSKVAAIPPIECPYY